MLGRGVVPAFARRGLVVPDVLAGVGLQRHDRRQEQIVAAAGAAKPLVPRRSVAHADVEQVELGVIGHRVPHGAAAAKGPPLALPGGRGRLEDGRLERLRGVARHRVEAPRELAGRAVVGGDVAAHAVLRAAVADQHLVLDDARGAGDRVRLRRVDRDDRPGFLAGLGVEGDEASVEGSDVDAALPGRDAAVDHVAAGAGSDGAGHLRVVLPEELAGAGVDRLHLAPGARGVEDPVDGERRRLLPAVRVEVERPGEGQALHVGGRDLGEGGEALLVVGATVGQPVAIVLSAGAP